MKGALLVKFFIELWFSTFMKNFQGMRTGFHVEDNEQEGPNVTIWPLEFLALVIGRTRSA